MFPRFLRLTGLLSLLSGGFADAASFFPSTPFSDQAIGTTAAPFLNSPPGARAEALGEAYSAAANNSESVFWNPSGLASLEPMNARHPFQNAMQAMTDIEAQADAIAAKIKNNLATVEYQNAFAGKLRDELRSTQTSLADISKRTQSSSDLIQRGMAEKNSSDEKQRETSSQLRATLTLISQVITERIAGLAKAAESSGSGFQGEPAMNTRGALLANFAAEAQADLESLHHKVRDESERLRSSARRAEQTPGNSSDISSNFDALLAGAYGGSLAYARQVDDYGAFGAGISYFSAGTIQGYNVTGDQTSSFAPSDFAAGLYYARRIRFFPATPGLKLGGGLKLIRSSIAEASGTGLAADLGLQIEHMADFGELPLDLGFAIRNFGPPMHIGGASDPLPFAAQGGFLWRLSPNVEGLLDGHLSVNNSPYVSVGLEWNFSMTEDLNASLRGGYNMKNSRGIDGGLTGMTAGLGVQLADFRVDYAWIPFGNLGFTNRITLGYGF